MWCLRKLQTIPHPLKVATLTRAVQMVLAAGGAWQPVAAGVTFGTLPPTGPRHSPHSTWTTGLVWWLRVLQCNVWRGVAWLARSTGCGRNYLSHRRDARAGSSAGSSAGQTRPKSSTPLTARVSPRTRGEDLTAALTARIKPSPPPLLNRRSQVQNVDCIATPLSRTSNWTARGPSAPAISSPSPGCTMVRHLVRFTARLYTGV